MKLFALGISLIGCLSIAAPAFADPPVAPAATTPAAPTPTPAATTPAPVTTQTATPMTIHGRADKPNVLIELARPSAASAASEAHAQMRIVWAKKLEPSATRAAR